jgi:hypothetical protein
MTQRVGFIIDGQLPSRAAWREGRCGVGALLQGWMSQNAIGQMRYGWVADWINQNQHDFRYELYRPYRRYAVVVFLKSMTQACQALAADLRDTPCKTIFDANVDYFTPASGQFYYDGMAPTPEQTANAIRMAALCDGVIGDSPHITEVATQHAAQTWWIPDNVRTDLIDRRNPWAYRGEERLPLLWSGQAFKLFELLLIRDVLEAFAPRLKLYLVTNALDVLEKCFEPYRSQLRALLEKLDYEHIPFTNIEDLMGLYDRGGVAISPRFLDNSYNLGHTEWKVTLPMARGRVALCSPQSSYVKVHERAEGGGIRVCDTADAWGHALEACLGGGMSWDAEEAQASHVVSEYYATHRVAADHAAALRDVIGPSTRTSHA